MDLAGLAACNWLVTFEPPGGHLVPPGGHLVPPGGHLADTWLCLVAPLMLSRVELGQGEIKIRRKRHLFDGDVDKSHPLAIRSAFWV
jgi:hypothetical protein